MTSEDEIKAFHVHNFTLIQFVQYVFVSMDMHYFFRADLKVDGWETR